MTSTTTPNDSVKTFYDESERLVRFLTSSDKASFLTFLDALGRHQPFETALLQNYGTKFLTAAALEEKFREYASKEFGTSLPDIARRLADLAAARLLQRSSKLFRRVFAKFFLERCPGQEFCAVVL